MESTPFLRVQVSAPNFDLQSVISETKGLCQMQHKKNDLKTIFVRYQDASCAEIAAGKLRTNQNVIHVHPMPKWHFYKKTADLPQPDSEMAMPRTLMPSASSRSFSPQRPRPQRPFLPQPAMVPETSPNYMRCSYCSAFPVLLQCGACFTTFYCNGLCQKRHYETHKHSCVMPPLVLMQNHDEVSLPEMMRHNTLNFPYVSANGQQPASNYIPNGMQPQPHLPNFPRVSGNGQQSASNYMPNGMQAQPLVPNFPHVSPNGQQSGSNYMPNGMQPQPLIPNFTNVSANAQQPGLRNMPKGKPEKINVTTSPSQKKHAAPSAQVTTETGAGTSLSNKMSKLMQMQPLVPNFPHSSANGQQPASNNMPKGMPEKINSKPTPSSQKKHVAQVTTGTGPGSSPSNKMPKGMGTLPEKANAKATPSPPQKAEECQKTALQQADFPAVGATVKISFVGENEIYIYDAGPGPYGRPNSHIKLIRRCLEEGRKKGNILTKAPVFGDILLAPFSGEYYRAVVDSVEGNWAKVFFVDFGNSEKLEWAEFKTILEPDLKYADRIAHEVWIANISKFTEPIRMLLNELEAEEFELAQVIDMSNTSVKLVELRHPTELYYLSDKLRQLLKKDEEVGKSAEKNKIVVAPVPETYVPVLDDEIIETSIPEENGVELIIIDASYVHHSSSSQIAVLVKANQKKYGELMTEIHRYGEADQNEYKPQQCGELCLVYFESIWTRAMSTDVQSDTSDYMLFDMGILCSVPLKNVRRFPPKLSRTLYVVTDCVVDNPDTLFKLAKESTPENLRTKLIKVNVKPDLDSGGSQHVTVISVGDTVS